MNNENEKDVYSEELTRKRQIDGLKKIVRMIRKITLFSTPILFVIALVPGPFKFLRWMFFFLSLSIWYLTYAFKIVFPWEKGVIFRLGRPLRVQDAGWTIILKPLDKLVFVKILERRKDIEPQSIMLKEKLKIKIGDKEEELVIVVRVNAIFYFKVTDAKKALINVEDLEGSLYQLVLAILRNEVAVHDLLTLISNRVEISEKIKTAVGEEIEGEEEEETIEGLEEEREEEDKSWGVKITKLELQEVEIPEDIKEALHNVFKADRNRTATIIAADAEAIRVETVYGTYEKEDPHKIWRAIEAFERAADGKGNMIIVEQFKNLAKKFFANS